MSLFSFLSFFLLLFLLRLGFKIMGHCTVILFYNVFMSYGLVGWVCHGAVICL